MYAASHQAATAGVVVITCSIALCYNLVHSLMIQQTSAVTTTVLGEIKIVGLMVASYIFLGEAFSLYPTVPVQQCCAHTRKLATCIYASVSCMAACSVTHQPCQAAGCPGTIPRR